MPDRPLNNLLIITVILFTACSGMQSTSSENELGSTDFERQVNPFPVHDTTGAQIGHPFLGGFNAPRPQFVNIDGDADPDLFVQENTDELMFFEHTNTDSDSPLAWQTDKFQNLDIGEWFRFADLDQDGDLDLLTEQPYSYIRYYRNEGSAENPDFSLAADTLKDANGKPIFSDRQNIPNVTDIDCDGKLDLFIGRLDGTLMRYESTGRDSRDIPQFELVNKRFEGIEIVKQFGTMHGANTMAFVDIDKDGDQDLFWGDFFEPSLLLIENKGSCSNPDLQGEPQPFPPSNPVESSGYNAPTFTDWDQDGNIDLFLGVLGGAYNATQTLADNFYFYKQENNGTFSLQSKRFLNTIDIGNESIPAVGDIDGDGDSDLLLANKIDPVDDNTSIVYQFENRGSAEKPSLHNTGALDLPDTYHYAPSLGDLNGNGRADLLLGTWKGRVAYYQNTADGFELVSKSLIELERGSNSAPALADIDDDGDLDLFVGSSGGDIHIYRNEGTGNEPEFVLEKDAFSDVRADSRSTPELHDIDGDGDLDLFLGTKTEGLLFFRNTGSAGKPTFEQEALPVALNVPSLGTPRFADFDGDGTAEFLSGGEGGGLIFYSR
ncbi:VCBS repeat-containing protein [Aliifodinibius salicampi]|uniref:VCBS repeat-containing protein n=1 Tax=Fodinibius salicampi TaxID=1920655 RepID=A0ABT3Q105_9BACT|nr:VCBS repeat-containing protein [Fodinibius salicampi]MCW9713787.1 VCBS repeat-containing protein [Fodinibius salicampi]